MIQYKNLSSSGILNSTATTSGSVSLQESSKSDVPKTRYIQ